MKEFSDIKKNFVFLVNCRSCKKILEYEWSLDCLYLLHVKKTTIEELSEIAEYYAKINEEETTNSENENGPAQNKHRRIICEEAERVLDLINNEITLCKNKKQELKNLFNEQMNLEKLNKVILELEASHVQFDKEIGLGYERVGEIQEFRGKVANLI